MDQNQTRAPTRGSLLTASADERPQAPARPAAHLRRQRQRGCRLELVVQHRLHQLLAAACTPAREVGGVHVSGAGDGLIAGGREAREGCLRCGRRLRGRTSGTQSANARVQQKWLPTP